MRITTTRIICQIFFFVLFLWLCFVSQVGKQFFELRGWPINWIMQLDPLVALATLLTTQTLYKGLVWAILTIILTLIFGRFFCGWICPLGAVQHFAGFIRNRSKKAQDRISANQYHPAQNIKYYILIVLLCFCVSDLIWLGIGRLSHNTAAFSTSSLQIGLLDPIPLIYRSFNLVIMPLLKALVIDLTLPARFYENALSIGIPFLAIVLLTIARPRFYCRFICPLGALFGVISSISLFKISKDKNHPSPKGCKNCHLCESHCEGACQPSSQIRINECVLCFNCKSDCPQHLLTYRTQPSVSGQIARPDLHRRGMLISLASGITTIPMLRLNGSLQTNTNARLIRPPGALPEASFLDRCIKCGQCMRICPTNVIQPAGLEYGLESIWTPALNFKIGSSGCQQNCIACGQVCPTAAIRPLTLSQRLGRKDFEKTGPIRIGAAFVDQGRCLPWAMQKPCIVCQENCPVSPKAITTQLVFQTIRTFSIEHASESSITIAGPALKPGQYGTGDYFLKFAGMDKPIKIMDNSDIKITYAQKDDKNEEDHENSGMTAPQSRVADVLIRLMRPVVHPERCIGCGVCEHECPVKGKRAIRVYAENESRNKNHKLVL